MSPVSMWESSGIENAIREILTRQHPVAPNHRFRRPFLNAYQIAIEIQDNYSTIFNLIGKPVGGEGSGESLARYIACELSSIIKNNRIAYIEGAFLSSQHEQTLSYNGGVVSTLTDSGYDLSIYRLKEQEE